MALEWVTYAALGERLGISPEAVRQRAIRHEWTRRTGNDGRAEIRVDVEELVAAQPPKPQADRTADASPTPEHTPGDPPADAPTFTMMLASLREMLERADAQTERERERAADERMRADRERDRADSLAADLAQLRAEGSRQVADVERDVAQLRALLDAMRTAEKATKPWWQGIADALAGRKA